MTHIKTSYISTTIKLSINFKKIRQIPIQVRQLNNFVRPSRNTVARTCPKNLKQYYPKHRVRCVLNIIDILLSRDVDKHIQYLWYLCKYIFKLVNVHKWDIRNGLPSFLFVNAIFIKSIRIIFS